MTPDQAPWRRLGSIRQMVAERTRIDTRALAVVRVGAAVLILADLLSRARHLEVMYTDAGVLPRSVAREVAPEGALSLFFLTGDPLGVAALFVLHGLVAVGLLVGYHTRLMTVLALVFVVSLDLRNVLVLSHADYLFRLLVLWAVFLPLGERWSVDAVHRARPPRASVTGVAAAAFLGQLVVMYAANGLWKVVGDGWWSGEAPMLVFGRDELTFLLGDAVRAVPELLAVGGVAWFALMLASPLLLVLTGRSRAALALAYAGGHLAFAVTVRIGAFPYAALMGLVAFVQPAVWDRWADRLQTPARTRRHRSLSAGLADRATRVPRPTIGSPRRWHQARAVGLALVLGSMLVLALVLAPQAGALVDDDLPREERLDRALADVPGAQELLAAQRAVGIDQPSWTIFAPNPQTNDRYHVLAAKTGDGEWIDLATGGAVSLDRPVDPLQAQYPTYRDRFYVNGIDREPAAAEALSEYLCDRHDDADLVSITVVRVSESVTPATLDAPEDRDRTVHTLAVHGCGDHDPVPYEVPEDWG